MAKVSPFRAVRYRDRPDLSAVVAPPYDLITPPEREELLAHDPHNIVRVTLAGSGDYQSAGRLLHRWLAAGVLALDPAERYYLYTCDYEETTTAGLLCSLAIQPLGEGSIHPHERTMPGPKADRLEMMRATAANLEPIWLVSLETMRLIAGLAGSCSSRNPLAEARLSGATHRLYDLDPGLGGEIEARLEPARLLIADGHHRYESAIAYAEERRNAAGGGPWDQVLALIEDPVEHPPRLLPTHRVVDATGLEDLAERVPLVPFDGLLPELAQSVRAGSIGVARRDGRWTFDAPARLDTEYLHDRVLKPMSLEPIYDHDLESIQAAITRGATAFILAPPGLSTVMDLAAAGERMPPKTTLFWPKPPSGLVLRLLRSSRPSDTMA